MPFLAAALVQAILTRDVALSLPLKSGTDPAGVIWGDSGRKADHATVAINAAKDICIAYHTDRSDEIQAGYVSGLKQVEVALFRYNGGSPETWTHVATELLGSIYLDPDLQQTRIKCERPDVIALDEKFFVTWTRRDDRSFNELEPAILECAWLEWNGAAFAIHASGTAGLGYELDRHSGLSSFYVRECSGVPDAVSLRDLAGAGTWTAGVVYPHQTAFSHLTPGIRRFDLRFVTCTIDANGALTKNPTAQPLVADAIFDGPNDPLASPGLILPDLAPGTRPERFWLTFEEQLGAVGSLLEGRVHLQLWERDMQGSWNVKPGSSITYGSAANNLSRRRPNVASFPQNAAGLELVTLAFNRALVPADGDVSYQQWQFAEGSTTLVPWTIRDNFPNSAANDVMPVPVHGASLPILRRCYVGRKGAMDELLEHSAGRRTPTVIAASALGLGRPAVSYLYDDSNPSPHYLPVTWEEIPSGGAELEVRIRVR